VVELQLLLLRRATLELRQIVCTMPVIGPTVTVQSSNNVSLIVAQFGTICWERVRLVLAVLTGGEDPL